MLRYYVYVWIVVRRLHHLLSGSASFVRARLALTKEADWMLEYSFPRLFVPWNIRSHDGTFVLGTSRSLELSFSRLFVPWNIRSLDRSFPGTFVPGTVRSLDHSFPRPNITRKIHSLHYNRSNTSFIVYVKCLHELHVGKWRSEADICKNISIFVTLWSGWPYVSTYST